MRLYQSAKAGVLDFVRVAAPCLPHNAQSY